MEFTIYADGGCSGNKRNAGCKGAYAFIILDPGSNEVASGSAIIENTTNNRMELQAVISGLKHLANECLDKTGLASSTEVVDCFVKSDSKYVVDNYNDYIEIWKKNKWRKSSGGQVINSDLWTMLDFLAHHFKSFKLKWIKGHSTDKFNQKVDGMVKSCLYP
jgi:ribonuclease HI